MKGVILIAAGHSYYGNYAHTLCMSIKSVDPSINVSVAYCEGALNHLINDKFDHKIAIPEECYHTKGIKDYLRTKVYLYDLTPYNETIFIDADVIWLPQKPISQLFEQFKDINFTMSNRGVEKIGEAKPGFIHWGTPNVLMEEYKIKPEEPLYNLASEFIYFKKCKEVKKLFNEAKKVFDNPPSIFKQFAHGLPDELAFEIAMIKSKVYPHVSPFIPFYWEQFEKREMPVYEIYKQYYGYSLGGNVNTGNVASIYNNLANHYSRQFGYKGYFPAKNKKSFLNERQLL